MLKLGDYYEDDAKSIADYLRKAGIKVELKPSIDASIKTEEFLQGRFSELKDVIKDRELIESHERYLNALKKVLESRSSPEEFQEKYLKELFPSIDAKREKLREMAEMKEQKEDSIEAKDEQQSQTVGLEEDAEPDDEFQELASEMARIFIENQKAKAFAVSVISMNEIEPGEDIGGRLDDPVAAIQVDLDDYGTEHPMAKSAISVYLDKCYELYVDELSTIHSDRLDDEFVKQFTDEHIKITSLNYLLYNLIENHSSEKMDLKTFEEDCMLIADSKNITLRVIGYGVAEEIAKVLEKNGLIKIKGDTIRWKK